MIEIELRRKSGISLWATLDYEDFDLVKDYNWHAHQGGRTFYAYTHFTVNGRRTTAGMHRIITGWPLTDHIDRNGLNNTRANLRPTTHSQNNANILKQRGVNTSPFKGVYWSAACRKWRARIKVKSRVIQLGMFEREEDAALAYDVAALHYFGEFACVNFRTAA